MSKYILSVVGVCLIVLTGCNKDTSGLPQKPYEAWRLGGRYPNQFKAKVFNVYIKTQSNTLGGAFIRIGSEQLRSQYNILTQWSVPQGWPYADYASGDLPEEIYVCWVSFVDQTFYKTKIVVPLEIRRQMVVPFDDYYHVPETNKVEKYTDYFDTIILGFAPGGNVVAWLTGVIPKETIEFATGETERLGQHSKECPNPYPDGKIPEVGPHVKAWLKEHGMPGHWQEKPSVYDMPSWKKAKLSHKE